MQFRIDTAGAQPDLAAIEQRLCDTDPAALVDLDPAGRVIRVSTTVREHQLAALVSAAGFAIDVSRIESVPSECCGGCSG